MTAATRYPLLLAVLMLLTGCASASLRLDLAVYKEDPNAAGALTPEQIDAMLADLNTIVQDAKSYAESRKKLGASLVDVLTAFSTLRGQVLAAGRGEMYTPGEEERDLRPMRNYVPKFNDAIDARLSAVDRRAAEAKAALTEYRKLLDPAAQAAKSGSAGAKAKDAGGASLSLQKQVLTAQAAARSSIEMVSVALQQLTGNLDTDLEKSIRRDPQRFAAVMKPEVLESLGANEAGKAAVAQLATRLQELQTTIKTIDAQGIRISEQAQKQLAGALGALNAEGPSRATLDQTAAAMREVAASPPRSAALDQALADITARNAVWWSQIERLQNPADPVWRVVTDPSNAAKWNESFSKTYFYAEGNTSVCIVRDSPIDFRVQQGANNPAALVQAQLQVSRAIGNAALTVAGAAAGVNLTAFTQTPAATEQDQTESDAEKLARRRATVREESAVRASAVRGLVISLRNFRAQLNSATDATDVKPITDNIVDALRGYQKLFETSSDSPAPKQ